MVYVAGGLVVFLVVCAAAHRWFRSRALAVEHGGEPTAERVHRLQRLALWQSAALALLLGILGGAVGAGAGLIQRHHDRVADKASLLVATLVALVAVALSVRGTVRPALARVRDVPLKPANRRRMLAVTIPVGLLIGAAVGAMFALAPRHGGGRIAVVVGGYFLIVVVLQSLLAPLLVVGLRSRPLPDDVHRRLLRLAGQMGVRVDVRAFDGREQKIANAAQIGTIPRLR